MNFPIAKYRFECLATEDVRMPVFSGSALRGAFGYMLRKVSCMTKQPTCNGCPLRRTCPYGQVFEPEPAMESGFSEEQTPPAYVIEPFPMGQRDIKSGDRFSFNLILIGVARQQLAMIIFVWEQILAQGLRKPAGKAKLCAVYWQQDNGQDFLVYEESKSLIAHDANLQVPATPESKFINIELLTPTRIRTGGSRLGTRRIQPEDFLRAAHRRYRLMSRQYELPDLGRPDSAQLSVAQDYRELHWLDWTRYSSRQDQEMTLGGLVGVWQLSFPEINRWWPHIYVGQWLHVGKNAAFGMGHYQLTLTDENMAIKPKAEG